MTNHSTNNSPYDCLIIGAGAAGLLCASLLGKKGVKVLLIEHTKKIGAKILISGGGRCNFTNMDAGPSNYISSNPHYMKSAMKRYTPWDFIDLLSAHGLTYNEKKLGQLFCDQGSKAVVEALIKECEEAAVEIAVDCSIHSIEHQEGYTLVTKEGRSFQSNQLVIATGGLSIPKMGATGFAYDVARQFNIPVTKTEPALVPLTFTSDDLTFMKELTGVSIDSLVTVGTTSFRENILFTHRGISGPAILQISSFWSLGRPIHIDLHPSGSLKEALINARQTRPKQQLATFLSDFFPARFAKAFTEKYLENIPLTQISNKKLEGFLEIIHHWTLTPNGSEGYRTAEVTKGGVDPNALSSKTMAALTQPGLYFIGECVDVTGWLGGYNFQWAWASAAAAAESITENLS
ncbi:NAD(P)/FAD-dependent oxidoreductase [Temperatibacter marinus]|uniref:NAD(P)/FAD-dependent oxidoreductase n=1 Tax=Temperatibacter marinus TaxID=1456591 RepID=A0AA52HB01_9PROT|nr:NAD(P)/FAD-dependent oxidoreductase [Temperatibacter marinus]WND04132.1 NAD(P)/FAD-dependent oxidoreductase [Temperatibacter marinus]